MLHPLRSALRSFLIRPTTLLRSADRRRVTRSRQVFRRPSQIQARALEALAHALEYLEDNALATGTPFKEDDRDAIRLLADRSRAVFAECPEIISWRQRLGMYVDNASVAAGQKVSPSVKVTAFYPNSD